MEYHYNYDPKTGEPIRKNVAPQNGNNNNKGDVGFWIVAGVFLLIGAWPVSLIMLIIKMADGNARKDVAKTINKTATTVRNNINTTQKTTASAGTQTKTQSNVNQKVHNITKTPQYSQTGARVMKIVGIIIAAIGALAALGTVGDIPYMTSVWSLISDFFMSAGFLATGLGLLIGGNSMTRRSRRFARYIACAGGRGAVSIKELAEAADVKETKCEKDLEIMIEKGLWGEGAYIDSGRNMLFISHSEAAAWFEKRDAKKAKVAPAVEVDTGYSGQLRAIRRANDRIADPVLSQKIDRLEEITGKIFKIVENNPKKKEQASTFLNYYLPTTQKLLDSYADFEEAGVSGENLGQAKVRIEKTMDNIIDGFESQLDKLYQAEAMDIDSDIRVMESMLRRDTGSVEDDFGIGVATAIDEEDFE